ncbi:MAG: trypsin-like peptidase domain-containing protein [Planctomycetes bacterium]|nr:trypsin-like peptidase domain-containing protein [Planctomycetota bacterium]
MMLALAAALTCMQDPSLAAVLAAQDHRVAVMERCAAAVCSVMSMDSPGGGSGVVFDPAGFVLTNFHVVGGADKDFKLPEAPEPPDAELQAFKDANPDAKDGEVAAFTERWKTAWRADNLPRGSAQYANKKVGLPDGYLYQAEVLGIDPGSDLAVLRLLPRFDGQTFAHCEFGDSDQLLVGETVFAMGNPFLLATDFTPTVTFGIVSGTHRYQEGQGQRMLVYPDCIQVDAPVNPGNSGGPLFNERGEIVGINGRISIGDRGRVNVGVGFAIASNQIANFLGDLMAGRHAEHGTMDMSAWFMNSRTEGETRRGVFVQQLFKDSVVASAGLSLGDEITAFQGTEVRSANQLATLVGVLPAGTYVTLRFRPSLAAGGFGEERQIGVRLATLDTGSSLDGGGDQARLASGNNRKLAAKALSRSWRTELVGSEVVGAARGADHKIVRRLGAAIAIDLAFGDRTLLIAPDGERPMGAEERALLAREQATNAFLWSADERADRLKDAQLLGGVHVFGKPAFRFGLPGDGDLEVWLRRDGAPAGYAFRDPVLRAHVAWYRDGDRVMRVIDGVAEADWHTCTSKDDAAAKGDTAKGDAAKEDK